MEQITLGSLFDGIAGFPLAALRNSITTIWASEIEPFPIRVTKVRFPDMKHLGDITKINGAEIEPVDIITFGSPCQDLSVAGKRAGLAGERSGLFMEAIRIIREMREHEKRIGRADINIRPRFAVWENVPGAFSSNFGEDFWAVLEETAKIADETITIPEPPKKWNKKANRWQYIWNTVGCIMGDGYSIAWRVLDAQYWGVPQKRRRIFLVADFGGQSAPEILFKREGLSRHIEKGREAREGIAADAERGVRETSGYVILESNQNHAMAYTDGVVSTLPASMGMGGGYVPMVAEKSITTAGVVSKGNGEAWITPERHMTLNTSGGQAGQGYPCIITKDTDVVKKTERGVDGAKQYLFENHSQDTRYVGPLEVSPIVSATFGMDGNNQPFVVNRAYSIQGSMIGRADKNGPQGDGINEDVSFTLNTTDRHAVATKVYGICSYASNSMKSDNPHSGIYEAETSRTIDLNGGSPACNQGGMAIVQCIEPGALSRGQGERVWDKCPTLRANMGDNQPCVVFNEETITSKTNASNPKPGDPCHTLGATGAGRTIVLNDQGGSVMDVSDKVGTLRAEMHGNIPAVTTYSFQRSDEFEETDKASTQSRRQYKDATDLIVSQRYSVRRLTPLECERLQGFPDGWTDIPGTTEISSRELEFWREVWLTWDKAQSEKPEEVRPRRDNALLKWLKNPTSDSAQYKALGNSVAVCCPEYVIEGIKEVLEG